MFCVGLIIGSNTKSSKLHKDISGVQKEITRRGRLFKKEIVVIFVEGHFVWDKQILLVLYNYVPRDSPPDN